MVAFCRSYLTAYTATRFCHPSTALLGLRKKLCMVCGFLPQPITSGPKNLRAIKFSLRHALAAQSSNYELSPLPPHTRAHVHTWCVSRLHTGEIVCAIRTVNGPCFCPEIASFAQNYSYDPHGKHIHEKGGLEWINAVLAGQHTEQNIVLESIPTETVRSLRYEFPNVHDNI